ncbi:PAQR family membrane homeostasis protein TrhA [Pseudomarimonas salicorniae]|uniref:Hemolysin III family protein n=1 Tax=Pseudomarimonas salicorniae TaxID=2933270 RepID=A0ABT0GDR3_9GAMM|nr:hemolysin III family protein [Lysobacter sp. CAU 1642]MCK7592685.1 hemolysin III family protein [Lysobacter sp. CAU 1642]
MPVNAPSYSTAEEIANALTHGIGALLAFGGSAVLITLAAVWGDGWQLGAAIAFGATLFVLYLASTLYHALPHPRAKHWFKVIDHCSIYLLIAGTYTPFSLIGLREHGGLWLFGLVWALAAAGVLFKLYTAGRFRGVSTALYVGMGWIAVIAAPGMLEHLPRDTLAWVGAGGIAYTVGVIFYLKRSLRFGHAVWHLFVIAGSVCHFVAVTQQVIAAEY